MTGQNPLKAGVKEKLDTLRGPAAEYRNAADTVPTADSLESARSHSGTGAVYPWNVLAEDYWDLYTLLLRIEGATRFACTGPVPGCDSSA